MLVSQQQHTGLVGQLVPSGSVGAGGTPVAFEAAGGLDVLMQQGLFVGILWQAVWQSISPGISKEVHHVEQEVSPACLAVVSDVQVVLLVHVVHTGELVQHFVVVSRR